ncbi:MAG: AAA family ATPase [Candidatus Baltobacteraceae bacterium]
MPLLAYLLLNREAPVTREKLGFILWPDTSEMDARANVRRHLHYVQRFLRDIDERFRLKATGNSVQWNPDLNVPFDVADFERLSARAETYAEACALYSGDLLADYYDDWVFPHRERLRTRYLQLLEELIRSERSRRNFSQALTYVQTLLAHDPWREAAIRQLMVLRYTLGDRSGALAFYESFLQRLHEDVGAAPMSDTAAIYDAILRNAPLGIDEDPGEAPEAGSKVSSVLPFTGRENVVEILGRHWERAARGHGSVVLMSGEPGIGKTRCARELAILAESQGARVLTGTTSFPESRPYQPLVEALRLALPMISTLEIDHVWLSAVSMLIPELRKREPSIPASPPLEGSKEQSRLFEGIAQVLAGLARSRPLLLILEDIHWAGAATISALEFIVRRVPKLSLMIVATYREDEVGRTHNLRPFRRQLEREALTTQVPLGRLPLAAIVQLVQNCGLEEAEGLASRFFNQSEGNPFFLTEAIRDYQAAPQDAQVLHGRAQDLIEKRILGLSGPAIALAESAAVIGAGFDLELLRELCGWSEQDLYNGLDELLGRFILREASQPYVDYSFSHHLFQSAVYNRIPPERRRVSHYRLARVLLELYPERIDDFASQIAVHLEQAGEHEQAATYYSRAARRALFYFANQESLDLIGRALECAPAHSQRFDFLALREELCGRVGDRGAQREVLDELQALVPRENPGTLLCEVLDRRAQYFHVIGDRASEQKTIAMLKAHSAQLSGQWLARANLLEAQYLESIGDLPAATSLTEDVLARCATSDWPHTALTMCLLGELYSTRGRYADAQHMLRRVLQRDDIQDNVPLHIRALRATTRSAIEQRDLEQALSAATELLALCRRIGDPEGEADAHGRLAAVGARGGNFKSAEEHFLLASRLYGSLNKPQGQAAILTNRGLHFFMVGQCTKALGSYAKAQALFEKIDDLRGKTVCALNSSQCQLYLGNFEESKRWAVDALALARGLTSPSLEATSRANIGAAHRELKEYDRAIEEMQAGILIRRGIDEPTDLASDLCDLALTYLAADDRKSAAGVFEELRGVQMIHRGSMLFPQYFSWACACVSRAIGDERAFAAYVTEAHADLNARVAQIDYAPYRRSYRRLLFNLQIRAAFKHLDESWTAKR